MLINVSFVIANIIKNNNNNNKNSNFSIYLL